jgi:hypothetical protein
MVTVRAGVADGADDPHSASKAATAKPAAAAIAHRAAKMDTFMPAARPLAGWSLGCPPCFS